MYTIYEPNNGRFSDRAHEAAKRLIYPDIFQCEPNDLKFESTLLNTSEKNRILDGEMAVDRIVSVNVAQLRVPLSVTVQERFRRPNYGRIYHDITITEWNNASNLPSELYKIKSGLFLYGYYNDQTNTFSDAIAFSVFDLQLKLITREISYARNTNKKAQDFICIDFDELTRLGLVRYRMRRSGK
jgi:hypothetical protein